MILIIIAYDPYGFTGDSGEDINHNLYPNIGCASELALNAVFG